MFYPRGEAEVALTVVATGNPPTAMMEALEETEDLSEADVTELTTGLTRTTPEFIDALFALQNYLPEGSTLQYDPEFGLGWQDPSGWLVYFGSDISNIDLKWRNTKRSSQNCRPRT